MGGSIGGMMWVEALTVACPYCRVVQGVRCVKRDGSGAEYPHMPRLSLARGLAYQPKVKFRPVD